MRGRARRLRALLSFAAEIAAVLDPEAVARLVVDRTRLLLGTDTAGLAREDAGGGTLSWRYFSGARDSDRVRCISLAAGTGVAGRAAAASEPLIVEDVGGDALLATCPIVQAEGLRSFVAVPLRGRERTRGALLVGNRRPTTFDADDVLLVSSLASHVAVALDNAELFRRASVTADRLQRLIESSGDAIITTDPDGRITSWNAGAQAIYGWSPEEAIGRVLPMVPPDHMDEARRMLDQLFGRGEPLPNHETERLRNDGRRIAVMVTGSPIRDAAGEIAGILGISRDMSVRRQVEEQQRRLSVLEDRERIAMELHDGAIQSLYAVGLGMEAVAQVLDADPALARDRLVQARDGLNQVIRDIRGYIAGLQTDAFEVRGLVAGLTELARDVEVNALAACEVAVAPEAETAFGPDAAGDIYQIAHEALSNVVRHAGASRAGLSLAPAREGWELRIWDNGPGFDPASPRPASAHGLRNMQARATRLGGTFRLRGGPGVSTEITCVFPAPVRPR